jgi:hypothetical protein
MISKFSHFENIPWKHTAIWGTLVPLFILSGAPQEILLIASVGTCSLIFLSLIAGRWQVDWKRAALVSALGVLLGALTAWFLQAHFQQQAPKSYAIILFIVLTAIVIDMFIFYRSVKFSVGFVIGVSYYLGLLLYCLFF